MTREEFDIQRSLGLFTDSREIVNVFGIDMNSPLVSKRVDDGFDHCPTRTWREIDQILDNIRKTLI